MPHVLIVHDSESARADLMRELQGEGCTVAEADSGSSAVREIWQGNFDAALIGDRLPPLNGASLEEQLRNLAPEIVTMRFGREPPARVARKLMDILDGAAAA
ncbi:MAG: response regulator [Deltaproteobacteria bacterium]|nr:response regulator [Deltaproteobacteria bacterium]